jgi:hypothetical protein
VVRALARALGLIPDVSEDDVQGAASTCAGPPVDLLMGDDAEDGARTEALERWWAEVDARAMRGEWGGEEEPPLEELERLWAREATSADGSEDMDPTENWSEPASMERDRAPSLVRETEPSWWAAADRAVDEASAALLDLDRGLARARRAVDFAGMADTADEDSWEQAPAARMTSAPDALAALAHASTAQRAALRHLLERTGGGGLVDRPRIAVTDALTGALLALTDARELRARGTCTRRAPPRHRGLHGRHDRAAGTGSAGAEPDLSPGCRSRPVRPRPRASMSPTRLP